MSLKAVSLGLEDIAFVDYLPKIQKETEGSQHECVCVRHSCLILKVPEM